MNSFDPSSATADTSDKWRVLQKFCLNISRTDITPLIETQTLLLYFKDHNRPMLLAANRALLLGSRWGKEPHRLHLLKGAVSASRELAPGPNISKAIIAAVRIELWQAYIRPIYRALFFGFDDVHEVSEEVLAPLCSNKDWSRGMSNTAIDLLHLIKKEPCTLVKEKGLDEIPIEANSGINKILPDCWELDKSDILLKRLVARTGSFL